MRFLLEMTTGLIVIVAAPLAWIFKGPMPAVCVVLIAGIIYGCGDQILSTFEKP